jgi:pyrroloquinoline-quinone synthase
MRLILAKSDDPAFRRAWIRRIHDHDGDGADEPGGLAQWLRLAEAVGLDRGRVAGCRDVLPGVRFACDAYVSLVDQSPLVVAVASSLTEFFAPDLMSRRIAAWEQHYRWVDKEALGYFRVRVARARRDSEEAIDFVTRHARTREVQEACVSARSARPNLVAPARLRSTSRRFGESGARTSLNDRASKASCGSPPKPG